MSDRIKALKTMRFNINRRMIFWRDTESDPHGIAKAVYVAMQEILSALNETIDELDK